MLGAILYLSLEEAISLWTDQTHVLIGPLLRPRRHLWPEKRVGAGALTTQGLRMSAG